jgi:hypothetical protein
MTSAREKLPNRRSSLLFDYQSMDLPFTASVSYYPDGRISELFCDNHKAGSAIGTLVRDAAIIFSFAVQHGADPEAIRRALGRSSDGRALGSIAEALDRIIGERP